LTPPNGDPATGMLAALFLSALIWNVGTWALGIPNSSSHALIGSLIGISVASALKRNASINGEVDWQQILQVLESLLVSPILRVCRPIVLYPLVKAPFKDPHPYQPPKSHHPPVMWMRGIPVLPCKGLSFAHRANDGQKSIRLNQPAIIGLFPATFSVNRDI